MMATAVYFTLTEMETAMRKNGLKQIPLTKTETKLSVKTETKW